MNKAVQTRITTIVYIALVWAVSFLLVDENLGRAVSLGAISLLFLFLNFILKNNVLSAVLSLLFVFPFNITYELPGRLFDYDSYVGGVYINYLIPYISVIDLFGVLALGILILSIGLRSISMLSKSLLALISVYLLVHNLIFLDFITVILSLRILMLVGIGTLFIDWIDGNIDYLKVYKEKIIYSVVSIWGSVVFFQGLLGYLQFSRGSTFMMSAIGESLISTSLPNASYVDLDSNIYLRAYGTFPHPNLLAGFMILSFIIFLILSKIKWRFQRVMWVGIFMSVFFTLFTFSRSIIFLELLFLLGLLFRYLWILYKKRRERKKSSININGSAWFGPAIIFERYKGLMDGGDVSLTERMGLLEASVRVVLEKPMLGVGFGQFIRNMVPYAPQTKQGLTLLQPVHNVFLLIIAEHGVIAGSVIILSLVGYSLKMIFRSKMLTVSIMIGITILVVGMLDHYYLTLPQGMFIFISLLVLLKLLTYSYFHGERA